MHAVTRVLIWYCLRKKAVPEEYVSAVKDMYSECKILWLLAWDRRKDGHKTSAKSGICPQFFPFNFYLERHHRRNSKAGGVNDVVGR